jgi:hypothetical protein
MPQTSAEWLESQADRAFSRQRAQVDTAKLLATFTTGIGATIVATALQVDKPNKLDLTATCFLATSFVAVLAVILLDRLAVADESRVLTFSQLHHWSEEELIAELQTATIAAAYNNAEVVSIVRWALVFQVCLSAVAATLAAVSLLT